MKTSNQTYAQKNRLWKLHVNRTIKLAAIAHPETGGNWLMIHNWGNDQARAIYSRANVRWNAIESACSGTYTFTLHHEHVANQGAYLWCPHCRASA
jgi:hypothetical protein